MHVARVVRVAVLLLSLTTAGCVTSGSLRSESARAGVPTGVELEQTPFFPQLEHECGPAALATVLVASGAAVTPGQLAAEVYLPGRRGSLQPELVASVRRNGRLPYVLPQSLEAIIGQVAAGLPVVVLQKLGAGPWPGWHYAVVAGYDLESETLLLRSGAERELRMSARKFLLSWERAGRWAMVVLRPGHMPASPEAGRYLATTAALESIGQLDAARASYQAASVQWPRDPLPRLGLGNVAYAEGDGVTAEREYREVVRLDPGNVVAHNNLAEVLLERGCPAAARAEAETARRLAGDGPHAAAVHDTSRKVAAAPGTDRQGCPVP